MNLTKNSHKFSDHPRPPLPLPLPGRFFAAINFLPDPTAPQILSPPLGPVINPRTLSSDTSAVPNYFNRFLEREVVVLLGPEYIVLSIAGGKGECLRTLYFVRFSFRRAIEVTFSESPRRR